MIEWDRVEAMMIDQYHWLRPNQLLRSNAPVAQGKDGKGLE